MVFWRHRGVGMRQNSGIRFYIIILSGFPKRNRGSELSTGLSRGPLLLGTTFEFIKSPTECVDCSLLLSQGRRD